MGKKDEMIAELNEQVAGLTATLEASNKEALNQRERFMKQLKAEQEAKQQIIENFQKQMQELQNRKPILTVSVNISGLTGKEDITKCLEDARLMTIERLKVIGEEDSFKVMTHPHTMAYGMIR